jgi:hypothetical protein
LTGRMHLAILQDLEEHNQLWVDYRLSEVFWWAQDSSFIF